MFVVTTVTGRFHFTNDLFPYDLTSEMHKQFGDRNKNRSNSY